VLAPSALGARAGLESPGCWPAPANDAPAHPQRIRVPALRQPSGAAAALEEAYRCSLATASVQDASSADLAELAALYDRARRDHPHEWLLYWNLLERFAPAARHLPLTRRLQSHLIRLEEHHAGRHPVTMGLEYLTLRV
jgi:hypothetical protein